VFNEFEQMSKHGPANAIQAPSRESEIRINIAFHKIIIKTKSLGASQTHT
jgi:hypothetical protein